jgi:hypothetical protein
MPRVLALIAKRAEEAGLNRSQYVEKVVLEAEVKAVSKSA